MQQISIIGFGRFGKTLFRLLKDEFQVVVYDTSEHAFDGVKLSKHARKAKDLAEVYTSEVIFFAVPIAAFEKVVSAHKKHFKDQLLVDVLSVKTHPKKVFEKVLKGTHARAMLTHPLFGPDSSKDGFEGLPLVIDKYTATKKEEESWIKLFKDKGLRVMEMTADEHDRLAADSQGLTHFVGRLLEKFKLAPTPIDTVGARKLNEVMEQTVNDTWELFTNLQTYNPYTRKMRLRLGRAYDALYNELLPKHVEKGFVTIGIQGGKGSFNEEAAHVYAAKHKIDNMKLVYLYTTEKVLSELHKGTIDMGQFAIQNSVGGLVDESIKAMASYRFVIKEEFAIPIAHQLMKRKDIAKDAITTIMGHPQTIKQCTTTLAKKFPKLIKTSGKGAYIDTAKAAEGVAQGKIANTTAILGPKVLTEIYDLEVIASNLQDDKTNNTSFLMVSR